MSDTRDINRKRSVGGTSTRAGCGSTLRNGLKIVLWQVLGHWKAPRYLHALRGEPAMMLGLLKLHWMALWTATVWLPGCHCAQIFLQTIYAPRLGRTRLHSPTFLRARAWVGRFSHSATTQSILGLPQNATAQLISIHSSTST